MAIKDEKTPRLGLLLPYTDNFLQDDVTRLRESFGLLDVLVVVRDPATGKIADSELSAVIAKLDSQGKLISSQIPSSVVQKGPDGKIDASLMPSIAVVDTFPVPNEAAMLGLTCERGDIAIREDLGKTYILTQMPPSVLSNWRELTSTNVTSVNGKTGAVTGLATSGANNDITSLNALSGPLRLGGDAVSDYDAVTLRQLLASSGGAGGASMNGVMNNFIGAVEWFNGSRAKIPAGYIPADGQTVSRTDAATIDLWAAVNAGIYVSVTDALWMNAGGTDFAVIKNRAKYSTGDGSTNFRVPDLNGVETQTPSGLFLRGSGKGTIGAPGDVYINAAPNIIGSTGVSDNNGNVGGLAPGSGAFVTQNNPGKVPTWTAGAAVGTRYSNLNFDASQSNQVYGRESTSEVRPNHAVGIWIIRANGSFKAANTSFNVLNGDTVAPSAGTVVRGGDLISAYQIGGVDYVQSRFRVKVTIGGEAIPEILLRDSRSGTAVDTVRPIRNGASADVGYSLQTVNAPALNSRTVIANPFGNNTPVICRAEVFHGVLNKWMSAPWTWVQANNNTYGSSAWYSEGEGIVLKIGSMGYVSATVYTGASQEISTPLAVASNIRIHIWKLVP